MVISSFLSFVNKLDLAGTALSAFLFPLGGATDSGSYCITMGETLRKQTE